MALLGVRLDLVQHLPAGEVREAAQRALGQVLAEHEGARAWTLERRGDTWWALIPEVDVKQALSLARELVEAARRRTVEAGGRSRRLSASCAVAHSRHRSRPSLATCVAVVEEGLRVAAAGGGRRAVHSEVYETFAHAQPDPTPAHPTPAVAPPRSSPPIRRELEIVPQDGSSTRPREVELPRSGPRGVEGQPAAPEPGARAGHALEREWSRRAQDPSPEAPAAPATPPTARAVAAQPVAARPVADEPTHASGLEASELLHRRLTKLTRELERAEAEIARLRARVSRDAAGLSSIYREVQGLSEDAPLAELKRSLMARIFEANVELRELVRQQG